MANILVTGANGFLGRRLCELWNPEDNIIKVDLYGDVDYITDLTNLESFQKIVRDTNPDLIIHLAALSNSIGLPTNQDARALIGVNVLSTFVVQYITEQENIANLIIAGSMAEYGSTPLGEEPPSETELINAKPTESYALSKKIGTALVQSETGLVKVLHFANLYGPGQKDKVVHKIIHCALNHDVFNITGDGRSARQYLYVDDAINAIQLIYNDKAYHSAIDVNIGPGLETSIYELAILINTLIKEQLSPSRFKHLTIQTSCTDVPVNRVCMDSSFAYKQYGWKPEVSLENGLRRTIKAAIEEYYGNC